MWDSVQPELGWRLQFFGDEPGPLLVRESDRCAMLVIGTREHVGFGRILSGSVSHYCLSHAAARSSQCHRCGSGGSLISIRFRPRRPCPL